MADMKPYPLTMAEWKELMAIPFVREGWGLDDNTSPEEFASLVYAAKFNFVSGSPGYVGDLYILQGDHLTGEPPFVFLRSSNGQLTLAR